MHESIAPLVEHGGLLDCGQRKRLDSFVEAFAAGDEIGANLRSAIGTVGGGQARPPGWSRRSASHTRNVRRLPYLRMRPRRNVI
jgi:hypothetical protein